MLRITHLQLNHLIIDSKELEHIGNEAADDLLILLQQDTYACIHGDHLTFSKVDPGKKLFFNSKPLKCEILEEALVSHIEKQKEKSRTKDHPSWKKIKMILRNYHPSYSSIPFHTQFPPKCSSQLFAHRKVIGRSLKPLKTHDYHASKRTVKAKQFLS